MNIVKTDTGLALHVSLAEAKELLIGLEGSLSESFYKDEDLAAELANQLEPHAETDFNIEEFRCSNCGGASDTPKCRMYLCRNVVPRGMAGTPGLGKSWAMKQLAEMANWPFVIHAGNRPEDGAGVTGMPWVVTHNTPYEFEGTLQQNEEAEAYPHRFVQEEN